MKHINSLLKKVGKGQGGFTLIELLIVIVILGIIAAVVALNVGGFLGTGQLQAANTEASNVRAAVVAYMADNNMFTLGTGETDATVGGADGSLNDVITPYLEGGPGLLKAVYTVKVDATGGCMITDAVSTGDGGWDAATIVFCPAECSWVKAGECGGGEG